MYYYDLLEVVIICYVENMKNLKEVFKVNDLFVNEEDELIKMIIKVVMLVCNRVRVKEVVFECG